MAKLYLKEEEGWVNLYENDEESLGKTEKEIRAKVLVSSMFDDFYECSQSLIYCGNRRNCRTEVYHRIF